RMQGGGAAKTAAENVLCYVLIQLLKLLHPFMPFITEEIYQALPHVAGEGAELIMVSDWPVYQEKFSFQAEEEAMELVMDAIRSVRARRAEMNVSPARKVKFVIASDHPDVFTAGIPFFQRLASASEVEVTGVS